MRKSNGMEASSVSSSAHSTKGTSGRSRGKAPKRRKAPKRAEPATGADRRMAERVAVDIDVDYSSDDTFLFANSANITNLSALGVFVRTTEPEPVGTEINLRFQVPGQDEPLVLAGEVVWVNALHRDGQDNLNPGMGVRFSNLDLEQRETLVGLVRTLALLVDDE